MSAEEELHASGSGSGLRHLSGLYEWTDSMPIQASPENGALPPDDTEEPLETEHRAEAREELRLDVDGPQPQHVASGALFQGSSANVHWIARLVAEGPKIWSGAIFHKTGDDAAFPYKNVRIEVIPAEGSHKLKVTFSGAELPDLQRLFTFKSSSFRSIEFEFDFVAGVHAAMQINTHGHPARPSDLPNEKLTIPMVFERAGFEVKVNESSAVPIAGAGPNAQWSNMELHDAMQVSWSKFASSPQWAMWVLYAGQHEDGPLLGGTMFDRIGPNQRQGCAIFTNSFISKPLPSESANAQAWIERMHFWSACHEIGHAFNLAHSWEKTFGTPWLPVTSDAEARSFMNYPDNVQGRQRAFFLDFQYRFADEEVLFMRHAPERMVQMGNATWFDNHAFQQAEVSPEPALRLELRAERKLTRSGRLPGFQFMEPVVVELKLVNISTSPQSVPTKLLSGRNLTVIVKRKGRPAQEVLSFATYCWATELKVLQPGEALYESLFASVGKGGWGITEPGDYTIQVAVHWRKTDGVEDIVSNPLKIRVSRPRGMERELAQDFFTEDVGRVLSFGGSRVLHDANRTLQRVTELLSDRRVAIHAWVAQANAMMREYKQLSIPEGKPGSVRAARPFIEVKKADLDTARSLLLTAVRDPVAAAESLGNLDFNYYLTRFSEACLHAGKKDFAKEVLAVLTDGLLARNVATHVIGALMRIKSALGSNESE